MQTKTAIKIVRKTRNMESVNIKPRIVYNALRTLGYSAGVSDGRPTLRARKADCGINDVDTARTLVYRVPNNKLA